MRILINDHAGHPFQIQLSRSLASRGHQVLHTFTNDLQTPRGAVEKLPSDPDNFNIFALRLSEPFQRYGLVKRYFQEIKLGHLICEQVHRFRPDIVISANMPLGAQGQLINACRSKSIGFVFWLQDVLGVGIRNNVKKKLPYIGAVIGNYFSWFEKRLFHKSHAVVAITKDFVPLVKQAGVGEKNIHVIENWAPINDIPVVTKDNLWAKSEKVDRTFNFVYTGTLGMKHNPDLLLQLAEQMSAYENVRIIVASEGMGADYLRKESRRLDIENLKLLPFQPFSVLPQVQGAADVLVAILEKDASIFAVPSKILTYMCAKRPLLLAVPGANLAAKIVRSHHAGKVVEPDNVHDFFEAAEQLYQNASERSHMAENSYQYARNHFDITTITDKFETVISQIGTSTSDNSIETQVKYG